MQYINPCKYENKHTFNRSNTIPYINKNGINRIGELTLISTLLLQSILFFLGKY